MLRKMKFYHDFESCLPSSLVLKELTEAHQIRTISKTYTT